MCVSVSVKSEKTRYNLKRDKDQNITMNYKCPSSPAIHRNSRKIENVLVLQGGGSIGAFSCGVYKALVKEQINIDIVAGTSIGAINAAIIAGSKKSPANLRPEEALENFWLELADSNFEFIPDYFSFFYDFETKSLASRKNSAASANAAMFGVQKMFIPRWNPYYMFKDKQYFTPRNWTFLYDNTPLAKTLEKYIDYKKLDPGNIIENSSTSTASTTTDKPNRIRLIVTAVNVLTAEPLVYDSDKVPITSKHLLASSGYPNYGFPWTEIEEGIYGWDGSLLSNTPVREVIASSPRNNKNIFIVENYNRKIDRLPTNMTEVLDRAKDIMFCDKTLHSLKMSRVITRQIQLIEKLYDFFEKTENKDSLVDAGRHGVADDIEKIRSEYKNLVYNHGAEILSVTRILRDRLENPNVSKNADFSTKTIKELIRQGEKNTLRNIKEFKEKNDYNFRSRL